MQNASNVKAESRKPYPKPSYTQMPAEEARIFLLEHANRGQQRAKEMLELMFPKAKDSSGIAARSAAQS